MAVAFVLNGEIQREERVAPSTTVLDYLRVRLHLTGTKEGCAEGDCGACTIALGRVEGQGGHRGVRWQAVNSCIMLLSQLDGAIVKTVEGLASGDVLHPVQRVLAESDGTQCGFCTPGIVMSLYVLQQNGGVADDAGIRDCAIHEALAGNLCRCTGYRPIVDAARALCAGAPPPEAEIAAPEPSPRHAAGGELHLFPGSLAELVELRAAHPGATLMAGATDLGLIPAKMRSGFPLVLSTVRVPELKQVAVEDGALVLGAAVTYADALPQVEVAFPAFGALIRRIGSRQIRALGTLGGNLGTASPVGDTLPVLLALDAQVELAGPSGARRMQVDDFITGYRSTALARDEVIARLRLPLLAEGEALFVWKLSRRFDQDISTLLAAFRVKIEAGVLVSLSAAYGGMAERAKRARALEVALMGKPWGDAPPDGIEAALDADFSPLGDHRAGAAYRRAAAVNLVRRLHLATTRPDMLLSLEAL